MYGNAYRYIHLSLLGCLIKLINYKYTYPTAPATTTTAKTPTTTTKATTTTTKAPTTTNAPTTTTTEAPTTTTKPAPTTTPEPVTQPDPTYDDSGTSSIPSHFPFSLIVPC